MEKRFASVFKASTKILDNITSLYRTYPYLNPQFDRF